MSLQLEVFIMSWGSIQLSLYQMSVDVSNSSYVSQSFFIQSFALNFRSLCHEIQFRLSRGKKRVEEWRFLVFDDKGAYTMCKFCNIHFQTFIYINPSKFFHDAIIKHLLYFIMFTFSLIGHPRVLTIGGNWSRYWIHHN